MADLQELSGAAVAFSSYPPPKGETSKGFRDLGTIHTLAELEGGTLRYIRQTKEALSYHVWLAKDEGHFGYLIEGSAHIEWGARAMVVPAGFCFSVPGKARIYGDGICEAVLVSKPHYRSYFMAALVETEGRLRYIDGCTDSLLISPVKLGDPCLNLLYFPANTDQTMHTHPSNRIGMILSGNGVCVTEDDRGTTRTPLQPGMLFCIHTGGFHKFQTFDSHMRVLAYHPDSDYGPTDETHPMINRTMVGGISASKLPTLHTRNGAS